MKKFSKTLATFTLCASFLTMQLSAGAMMTGDTGLGKVDPHGNPMSGAVIKNYSGGYVGTDLGAKQATLKFNGSSHVIWDTLNVGRGETLNFNAVNGAKGLTVLNTVNKDMTQVYGNINANSGISNLIISNPNGLLFDGAKVTTAGDTMITTQGMGSVFAGNTMNVVGKNTEALNAVTIQDSDFSIGGTFNIVAPSIDAIKSTIKADTFKLITEDGQSYLVAPTSNGIASNTAVKLESVSVDGNVYIQSAKDMVKIVSGGKINGNLEVKSDGNVMLNYTDNGKLLDVKGNVKVDSDGRVSYLRNTKVGGNVDMSNSGGFLEIKNVDVAKDVNLKTTVATNQGVKHFIHVVGDNKIGGNLNVDSAHNIHIGGYVEDGDTNEYVLADGNLDVKGDINATAKEGTIAVTIDTKADNVNFNAGLNIISDDETVINANNYQFKANNYIGGIKSTENNTVDDLISAVMEGYKPLGNPAKAGTAMNISGGNITKLETPAYANIRANNDLLITGVNSNIVKVGSAKDIQITGKDVHANQIIVDGETVNLTVDTASGARDYLLTYTDIRDNEEISINKDTEITYEMANGENGLNSGNQIYGTNTRLIVKGTPIPPPGPVPPGPVPPGPVPPGPVPPGPDPDPDPIPPNESEKLLEFVPLDDVTKAPVYTPIAFAADLDEEIDTGVRKNVDGSVTVVRPYAVEE